MAIQTFASWPPTPASAILVLAMIPMALMGERLPALAPFATASAVRKRGTPARVAAAIAIGIRSATAMIAPGPTDDSANATPNSSSGSRRA